MANGWGELSFGIGEFGLQGNASTQVSGISSSTSIGSVTATGVIEIGWGGDAWNINAWGDLQGAYVDVTGVTLSANIGSLTSQGDANIIVSGIALTGAMTDVYAYTSVVEEVGSVSATIVTGNETTGIGAVATGSELNTNITGVTIDDRYLIGEGWGRDVWGGWAWGVNYSVLLNGISLNAVTGNEDAFTDYTQEITVSFGLNTAINAVDIQAGANIYVNVAEHTINTNIESVSITGSALVQLTGISTTIAQGEAIGGTIQEVPVTGSSLTVFSGNEETAGNADVSVTGSSITGSVGQAGYIAGYDVTGISATFSLGTVTLLGNANVVVTGTSLTINTITPNIIAWAEVSVGTSVTWTPVDLAA